MARAGRKAGITREDKASGGGCQALQGPAGQGEESGFHSGDVGFEPGSTAI